MAELIITTGNEVPGKKVVKIIGVVKGNIAEVSFFSHYGVGMGDSGSCMGIAKLVLNGDKIEWVILEPPANGYYWCPKEAILKKYGGK